MNAKDWIEIGGIALALIVFGLSLIQYRANSRHKRVEFLDKLIAEFNSKELEDARLVLDDFIVTEHNIRALREAKYNFKELPCYNLEETLRNHTEREIIDEDELRIRHSFEHLFEFYTKLAYYYSNQLISKREMFYFKYFLRKIDYVHHVNKDHKMKGAEIFVKTYYDPHEMELLFKLIA